MPPPAATPWPAADAAGVRLHRAPGLTALAHVRHGFTMRVGGVSTGAYASLNLGGRDDAPAAVAENRRRAAAALGLPADAWRALHQVHGVQLVAAATPAAAVAAATPPTAVAGAGAATPPAAAPDAAPATGSGPTPRRAPEAGPSADGHWATAPGALLAVLTADCVPVLLACRDGRAVMAIHAGWRGTAADIATAAVAALGRLGVAPARVVAAIGPAIGPCCFAIGADVAAALGRTATAVGAPTAVAPGRSGGAHADLWAINAAALHRAGVPRGQVDVVRTCTACAADQFSYRRDAGTTGRQAGLIALSP